MKYNALFVFSKKRQNLKLASAANFPSDLRFFHGGFFNFCIHVVIGDEGNKGRSSRFKKNTGQLFFDEESINEISKPYRKFVMDGRTHGWISSFL